MRSEDRNRGRGMAGLVPYQSEAPGSSQFPKQALGLAGARSNGQPWLSINPLPLHSMGASVPTVGCALCDWL